MSVCVCVSVYLLVRLLNFPHHNLKFLFYLVWLLNHDSHSIAGERTHALYLFIKHLNLSQ